MPTATNDPFDSLLTLEDTLYTSAYEQGTRDGARAGRIEGRIFGLEKGFEKFAALGALHGRAIVWSSPLTSPPSTTDALSSSTPRITRLKNNTHTLLHLSDPSTFSTLNTDDAVADYDDRFKRATAKCKIIERAVQVIGSSASDGIDLDDTVGTIEYDQHVDGHDEAGMGHLSPHHASLPTVDRTKARKSPRKVGPGQVNRATKISGSSGQHRKQSDNMEDFSLPSSSTTRLP
ncbi:unnamed protein product [Periconia digitata]|uniref:Essential protein Yae1 N-terminal domain-containing protein n=1 Tax=Periconia digitata TaxID=1303443 RepID=A0A9W4UN40_9PLEO|nr:unnamed protein product [Periconia digitata]